MNKKATEQIIDIAANKFYINKGPHLWISQTIYNKGPMTTKKLWEEYQRDESAERDLIKSKNHLRDRILP